MATFRMEYEEGQWIVFISAEGSTVRVTLDEFAKSGPCQVVVDNAVDDLYSTLEFGPPSAIHKLETKLQNKRLRKRWEKFNIPTTGDPKKS